MNSWPRLERRPAATAVASDAAFRPGDPPVGAAGLFMALRGFTPYDSSTVTMGQGATIAAPAISSTAPLSGLLAPVASRPADLRSRIGDG